MPSVSKNLAYLHLRVPDLQNITSQHNCKLRDFKTKITNNNVSKQFS